MIYKDEILTRFVGQDEEATPETEAPAEGEGEATETEETATPETEAPAEGEGEAVSMMDDEEPAPATEGEESPSEE